jgi:hypothetical protein
MSSKVKPVWMAAAARSLARVQLRTRMCTAAIPAMAGMGGMMAESRAGSDARTGSGPVTIGRSDGPARTENRGGLWVESRRTGIGGALALTGPAGTLSEAKALGGAAALTRPSATLSRGRG